MHWREALVTLARGHVGREPVAVDLLVVVQLHGDYLALATLDCIELDHVVRDLHVRHGDVRFDANIHDWPIDDLFVEIGIALSWFEMRKIGTRHCYATI